jgi:hypothetical protein
MFIDWLKEMNLGAIGTGGWIPGVVTGYWGLECEIPIPITTTKPTTRRI